MGCMSKSDPTGTFSNFLYKPFFTKENLVPKYVTKLLFDGHSCAGSGGRPEPNLKYVLDVT